jgi:hypothetical protein
MLQKLEQRNSRRIERAPAVFEDEEQLTVLQQMRAARRA